MLLTSFFLVTSPLNFPRWPDAAICRRLSATAVALDVGRSDDIFILSEGIGISIGDAMMVPTLVNVGTYI